MRNKHMLPSSLDPAGGSEIVGPHMDVKMSKALQVDISHTVAAGEDAGFLEQLAVRLDGDLALR